MEYPDKLACPLADHVQGISFGYLVFFHQDCHSVEYVFTSVSARLLRFLLCPAVEVVSIDDCLFYCTCRAASLFFLGLMKFQVLAVGT